MSVCVWQVVCACGGGGGDFRRVGEARKAGFVVRVLHNYGSTLLPLPRDMKIIVILLLPQVLFRSKVNSNELNVRLLQY